MDKAFPGLCCGCAEKSTCTTLCDMAETYVNQDYCKHQEKYIDPKVIETMPDDNWISRIESNYHLTRTEKKICTLFGYGLKREDLCELLHISRDTLRSHIRNLRKKLPKPARS